MDELQTDKGILRITRNLGIFATSSFALMSTAFATGILAQEPAIRYFSGALMLGNSFISGKITYDVNKELKKLK